MKEVYFPLFIKVPHSTGSSSGQSLREMCFVLCVGGKFGKKGVPPHFKFFHLNSRFPMLVFHKGGR